ncbi:Flagellin [Planctomycetes bacterium Pla163]|uniref:Flagellin n=1 Tax=Rohdeia mirabilis TaxID=2528008 RepID=A0A518D4T4_9BACT|nr:Flagellin [Planctomycetes bacterium Pla163]
MGLRVNTNIMSMSAQRNLGAVTERLGGNFSRLSSGLRIATASDDPAGLGISERMRGQIRSLSQASRNAQDGVSLVQTAEGALSEVHSSLHRMRELAIQAANGTYSTEDRAVLDVEFQQIIAEIDRVADSTEFNEIPLLDGSAASVSIQVGLDSAASDVIDVSLQDVRATTLGLSGGTFDVTSAANASTVLDIIDTATDSINTARGNLGAQQNRLNSSMRSILNVRENLSAAESRIRDVDVAMETADLTRNSIMQQAATSVLSQANSQPQIALSLLQQ